MVNIPVPIFTASALIFMMSGLLIPISYNHILASSPSPSPPPQSPLPPLAELSATQRSVSTNQLAH
jgi:hypothetical protein